MVWFGTMLAMVAVVSLVCAACRDVATRTIPNSIVAIIAVVGMIMRLPMGLTALAVSTVAASILFALLLLPYARGMLGGGDVKLIPAIALGLPLPSISHFVFITAMAGGVLGLVHLLARRMLRGAPPSPPPPRGTFLLRRVFQAERWRIARHGSLPYGVAIAGGGIWVIISMVGS